MSGQVTRTGTPAHFTTGAYRPEGGQHRAEVLPAPRAIETLEILVHNLCAYCEENL